MTVKRIAESGTLVSEASAESRTGKRFRAKIIQAGQGSSAFYPASVLESNASVFKAGTHMYFDHPTFTEEFDRPERSVKDLVGKLASDGVYSAVDEAIYADVEFYSWAGDTLAEMKDDIGLSIRAYGTAEESDDADAPTPVLTSFVEVLSVDVVTKAGAGGALLEMLESARESSLADHETVVETNKENVMNEEQEALLKQIAESLNNLNESLKPVVEAHRPAAPEAGAGEEAPEGPDPLEVASALADSGLTEAGRKQVVAAVKGGADLEESIKAQVEYEKAIAEAAKKPLSGYVVKDETKVEESGKAGFKGFKKAGN